MADLYSEYSRIGSEGPMRLGSTFRIDGRDAVYGPTVSRKGIEQEELAYAINGRRATLFSLGPDRKEIGRALSEGYAGDMAKDAAMYRDLRRSCR